MVRHTPFLVSGVISVCLFFFVVFFLGGGGVRRGRDCHSFSFGDLNDVIIKLLTKYEGDRGPAPSLAFIEMMPLCY